MNVHLHFIHQSLVIGDIGQIQKQLGLYVHSAFIKCCPSIRLAVDRLVDLLALSCRFKNQCTNSQFSPPLVMCANLDASSAVYVDIKSHDCARISSLICHCGRLSLARCSLRSKFAARYETTSAEAQVTSNFSSTRNTIHASACARVRLNLVLCYRGRAHCCNSWCRLKSLRTSTRRRLSFLRWEKLNIEEVSHCASRLKRVRRTPQETCPHGK